MNKLVAALVCIFFIYLISFASLPCPPCESSGQVTHVSVHSSPPSLSSSVSECMRSRDVRGVWNIETFVACSEVSPDGSDVSILLQLTLDRSHILIDLADRWKAPMSVAVYLPDDEYHLQELIKLHHDNENLRKFADLHVVYENDKIPYPANHLRNVALINARTDYVITLDVDFIPNRDMHKHLLKATKNLAQNEIYVVAAFESNDVFPSTKSELLAADKTEVFQVHYYKGIHAHLPTNYEKWYETDNEYEIKYEYSYEPYYLIQRKFCPLFDERFVGYGNDKSSHAYELAVAGYKFIVLPEPFIIHKNHPSPAWRAKGQGSNEAWQLWMDFVRNMKFKYGQIVEVPEWLKDACNKGDCPQFWLFY